MRARKIVSYNDEENVRIPQPILREVEAMLPTVRRYYNKNQQK